MTRLTLILLTLLVVPSWGAEAPTLSTPDGTVRHVLRGLADNRPEVIWQVLPAKHQALIENEIKQTLGTLDAQVHQKTFGVLREFVDVLKDKEDLLMQFLGGVAPAGPNANAAADFGPVMDVLGVLASSHLSNPQWARRPDVELLLKVDGAKLMTNPGFIKLVNKSLEQVLPAVKKLGGNGRPKVKSLKEFQTILKTAKVVVKESTLRTATLKLTQTNGKEIHTEEIKMVKEGNRWLPLPVAEAFKTALTKKRTEGETRLLGLPLNRGNMNARQKATAMKFLDTLDTSLDELDEAATQDEFGMKVMAIFMGILPQIENLQKEFGEKEPKPAPEPGAFFPNPPPPGLPPAQRIAPGFKIQWIVGVGNRNRIDKIYVGKPATIPKKTFGNPAQIKNGTWIYRGLKIRNLAIGKQMTTVEFEVTDGKVANVTVQL